MNFSKSNNSEEYSSAGSLSSFFLINKLALFYFILAGLTGLTFRLFFAYGINTGLDIVNIRHAHSHLMYFGWATPAILSLITLNMVKKNPAYNPKAILRILYALLFLSLPTYIFFLLYGYHPLLIGKAKLPLSVIFSGLHVIVWYFYFYHYRKLKKTIIRISEKNPELKFNPARLLWDISVIFLFLSSLGAWALALLKAPGFLSVFMSDTFKHLFLGLASDGFFVLAVLAFIVNDINKNTFREKEKNFRITVGIIFFSLIPTFFLGMPTSALPLLLKTVVFISTVIFSFSMLYLIYLIWNLLDREQKKNRAFILAALFLKSFGILFSIFMSESLINDFRLIYLHLMLLAFVSPGILFQTAKEFKPKLKINFNYFYTFITLLILSMIPLTNIWPEILSGNWRYPLPFWMSVLILVESIRIFIRLGIRKQS